MAAATDRASEPARLVPHDVLAAWIAEVFMTRGVGESDAQSTASLMVRTSLRGIDSHGIGRLPFYLDRLASGKAKAAPERRMRVVGNFIQYDGDLGLGHTTGLAAIGSAIELAGSTPFVACTVRRSGHLGALGLIALQAAERGMVALLCQSTPPFMATAGSTRPAIGNNPLAFAAPLANRPPLVFDMSCSVSSRGAIRLAALEGEPIPEGWALDRQGRPTADPAAALEGMLLPIGGHKGMGIAMLVECLSGVLGGLPGEGGSGPNAFIMVVNPDLLGQRRAFDAGMDRWLGTYLAAAPGARYPGERAAQAEAERRVLGIPIEASLLRLLRKAGETAGVSPPF